jgi:peptide/nickel transport system ATP-binding protein
LGDPQHLYTQSLIAAVPRADVKLDRFTSIDYVGNKSRSVPIDTRTHWLGQAYGERHIGPAIELKNVNLSFVLQKSWFKQHRKYVHAVNDVSFSVAQGETFGLVGESGSGKSTVARLVARLYRPDSGELLVNGVPVHKRAQSSHERTARHSLQMIFQDPYSSLNSRMKVLDIVAEPIRYYRTTESESQTRKVVGDLLEHVGLGANSALRYPHEFSGGQRQRISIARALAARPSILICDEPTSALDVSIQAQILNLLKDLQDELGLTMLFISHDLPVIRQMCTRVAVMNGGKICEIAETAQLFESPKHEYSRHLLNLMPSMEMLKATA